MNNIDTIIENILTKNPNIRETEEYHIEQGIMMDCTMSCDIFEATQYMKTWVNEARYDENFPNKDLETKLISAYDLHKSLSERLNEMISL